jgi:outer membrane protein assembly factor BamB
MSVVAGRRVKALALIVAAVACAAPPSRGDNWPAFRGADGRSVSTESDLPLKWGPKENVRWRVELPGRSNGSPIVWGDRVFVAQAVEPDKRRTVMCFGRADGKLLWQSGVAYAEKESTHPDNPYCSGTPATDGERVVACFGSAGLYGYDLAGKELWHRDLGKLNHMFGNAISPLIVGDLVVVNYGPGEGSRLVAVDKRTGAVAWEAQPPKVDPGERKISPERLAGPAVMVAPKFISTGDKNDDALLSREEMTNLGDAWYDQFDPAKAGKVSKEQFNQRAAELMPAMQGIPGVPKDYSPGRELAPHLFTAIDGDRDGSVTREEFKKAFGAWYANWGGGKDEPLDLNQVVDGLRAMVPAAPAPGSPANGAGGFGGAFGPGGSWSTPIVVRAGDHEELVVAFPNRLVGYDPKTGKQLWFSKDLSDAVQPSPLWCPEEGLIVAFSGDMGGGQLVAVRPGGSGDVTEGRRAWIQKRVKGSIGTGVAHGGRLYAISGDGFVLCHDLKTGKKLWQKRLEGASDKSSSWSSMLMAGDRIYAPNQGGDVFVLTAGREFEVLGTNSVNEPTNASLAASDGDLFLRTDKALWCVGK